jgi:hypothetical protein
MNYNIPENTMAALHRYVYYRVLPGSFLTSVLTNDLFGAYGRADTENLAAMKDILSYVYMEIPSVSWGNQEKVNQWVSGPAHPPEL